MLAPDLSNIIDIKLIFLKFELIPDPYIYQYSFIHFGPMATLGNLKCDFNNLLKSKIVNHWERELRLKASLITSAPHSLWLAFCSNHMSVTRQLLLLGCCLGDIPTDWLQRRWTQNKNG